MLRIRLGMRGRAERRVACEFLDARSRFKNAPRSRRSWAARLAARPLVRRPSAHTFPRKGGRAAARPRTPRLRVSWGARLRPRSRAACGVAQLSRQARTARSRLLANRLDDRRRSRRAAVARFHAARRALAPSRRPTAKSIRAISRCCSPTRTDVSTRMAASTGARWRAPPASGSRAATSSPAVRR